MGVRGDTEPPFGAAGDRIEPVLISLRDDNLVGQNASPDRVQTLTRCGHPAQQRSVTASLLVRDRDSPVTDGKQYNPHVDPRPAASGRAYTAASVIHREQLLHSLVARASTRRYRDSRSRS
jgi:hypothetical protein